MAVQIEMGRPADLAGEYLRGIQTGGSLAEAHARLQEQANHAQMEMQMRQQELERQTQMEQARLATAQARIQADTQLKQARLAQIAQANAEKTKNAAMQMAAQHAFSKDVASGIPIEQALYRHPGVNPRAAIAAHKDTLDVAGQQLDLRRQQLELEKQRVLDAEDRANKAPKPVELGEVVSENATEPGGPKTTTRRKIFGQPQITPPPQQFKKGQKARQNGTVYEFDGSNWNPLQ